MSGPAGESLIAVLAAYLAADPAVAAALGDRLYAPGLPAAPTPLPAMTLAQVGEGREERLADGGVEVERPRLRLAFYAAALEGARAAAAPVQAALEAPGDALGGGPPLALLCARRLSAEDRFDAKLGAAVHIQEWELWLAR